MQYLVLIYAAISQAAHLRRTGDEGPPVNSRPAKEDNSEYQTDHDLL